MISPDAAGDGRGLLSRRALLSAVALGACQPAPPPPAISPAPPSRRPAPGPPSSPLERAIHRAARYLVGIQRSSGRFRYRVQLDPALDARPGYNLLRHAGTLYALADYQGRWPNPAVALVLERGAAYLADRIGPVDSAPDAAAVWSPGGKAKLGGAGLALVAFQSLAAFAPSAAPLATQRRLARFVASLQQPDGAMVSRYLRGEGPDRSWTSLYYPGEAALGLLMLHDRDPEGGWERTAARALLHLAAIRRGDRDVPEDHWALIATARWLDSPRRDPDERSALVHHAEQIVDRMLGSRVPHRPGSPLHGCFGPHGRTTPTATRLEGLLAIAPHLDPERRASVAEHGASGVAFLRRAQVDEGPFEGAVPRALARLPALPAESDFNRDATEVRIDYVQHAMSAWMTWLDRADR